MSAEAVLSDSAASPFSAILTGRSRSLLLAELLCAAGIGGWLQLGPVGMLQLLNQPTALAETVSPTRLKVSYDLSDKPKPLAVLDTMAMTLEATLRHLAKTE